METIGRLLTFLGAAAAATLVWATPLGDEAPRDQKPEILRRSAGAPGTEHIEKATRSFRAGRFDEALEQLRDAVRADSTLPPAKLLLAELFLFHHLPEGARKALEQAAVEHPRVPGVYLLFGSLALEEGRLTDAALHYDKALELSSAKPGPSRSDEDARIEAQLGLASVAERRGDWVSARSLAKAVLASRPGDGRTRQRLARALFHLDARKEAYRELERAAKSDPSLDAPEIAFAHLFSDSGDTATARTWMQRAVRERPDDARTRQAYGHWLLARNEFEEAREQALAASALDPSSRTARVLVGLAAWHLADYAQAEQIFEALHQENPDDFFLTNALTLALAEQPDSSKRQRALDMAEASARRHSADPDARVSAEAYSTLGRVYYHLDRQDAAERALRVATARGTARPDTLYYLASVLARKGEDAQARGLLDSALSSGARFAFHREAEQLRRQLTR